MTTGKLSKDVRKALEWECNCGKKFKTIEEAYKHIDRYKKNN